MDEPSETYATEPPPSDELPGRARDILLTGFPHFVARRFLSTIMSREPDARVRLLVRPDFLDEADRRLEEMDVDRERVDLLSGDVVDLDLGLSGTEYLDVVTNVTDIYHIASIWFLGVEEQRLHDVNVEGARNVLDAAHEMKNLERLNHFSTAFVAGDRTGVIMEEELDEGQSFRNGFESTKFEAEQMMRRAMRQLPISIYRPSIIVGDSQTGEIGKLAGPYYLMNAIVLAPPGVPIPMPGKGDKPLNMVPIDYVCGAMYRLSLHPDGASKTFHLSDPNPLSAARVFELVAEHAGKRKPVGHLPYMLTRMVMRIPYLERLTRNPRQFVEEFNQLTLYNCINTIELLEGAVRCPPFPTYVDRVVDYIRNAEGSFNFEMPETGELLG